MSFIIRYAVVQMDSSPMYGKDKVFYQFKTKDQAVIVSKEMAKSFRNMCVEERRYASEENCLKGFTFDQSIVWVDWLQEVRK